jgi:hypothetical protein
MIRSVDDAVVEICAALLELKEPMRPIQSGEHPVVLAPDFRGFGND